MPTRTATQVASHAQKHFLRQTNPGKKKRRASLFDVVAVNGHDDEVRIYFGPIKFNSHQLLSIGIGSCSLINFWVWFQLPSPQSYTAATKPAPAEEILHTDRGDVPVKSRVLVCFMFSVSVTNSDITYTEFRT